MAKHNKKGRSINREHFTTIQRKTVEEPAWAAMSTTAQALYPWIKLEWKGRNYNNNAKIRFSVKQAAKRLGVSINTAAKAFHDLQAKGFIVVKEEARLGLSGAAKAPAYEITELPLPGEQQGRALYKEWSEGEDFPVEKARANNPTGKNGKTEPHHIFEDDSVVDFVTKQRSRSQIGR